MLIIEGPDLVGKTTFTQRAVKLLNSRGWPHVYRHLSRLPDSFDRYWGYQRLASGQVVQDRFHMSEPLYELARGEEPGTHGLDPDTYRFVDGMLRSMGAVTVVMCADPEHVDDLLVSRWRDEEMYHKDLVRDVNYEYHKVACNAGWWNDYRMDVDFTFCATPGTPWAPEEFLDEVVSAYQRRQLRLQRVATSTTKIPSLCHP